MANKNNLEEKEHKGSPVMAGMVGAAVGAGIGAAGSTLMQNKQFRAKVEEVFSRAREEMMRYMDSLSEKAVETKDQLMESEEKMIESGTKKAQELTGKDTEKGHRKTASHARTRSQTRS